MSQYESQKKYMTEKRENLGINLPKGTKDRWRRYIEEVYPNQSLSQLITDLIESDIRFNKWGDGK